MKEKFFELLRIANGVSEKFSDVPSPAQWQELYEISKSQSVLGIGFAAICKLDKSQYPPDDIYMKWFGWAAKIKKRNVLVNHRCVMLQKNLEAAGFKVCILKGQTNARLYPQPLLRQSGDVDVWLDGGFSRVLQFVNSVKPADEATDQDIEFKIYDDLEVELHYKLALLPNPFASRRLNQWFNAVQESGFVSVGLSDSENVNSLSAECNLVYQLVHIYRHFFELGIGLRQIMDYYYLLISSKNHGADFAFVRSKLQELGLMKFARSLMHVLGKVFGLGEELMLVEPDCKNGEFLLSEIMTTGNFGNSDSRIQLKDSDSHIVRFFKRLAHESRLFFNYPKDTFWNTIYIVTIFFRYRRIMRKLKTARQ